MGKQGRALIACRGRPRSGGGAGRTDGSEHMEGECWGWRETGGWDEVRSWQFLMADGRHRLCPERLLIPRQEGDMTKALFPKD